MRRVGDLARGRAGVLRADLAHRGRRALEAAPLPVRVGYGLAERTARDARRDRVLGLAAESALFTLISLPALMLVVLGSLGFVAGALGPEGTAELERIVFDLPRAVLSTTTYGAYEPLARDVVAGGRADVVGYGLLLSLWTGSRAVNRYLDTLAVAYDVDEPWSPWKRRVLALGITVAGQVGAVAVLPLLVLGPRLLRLVASDDVAAATLAALAWAYWPGLGLLLLAALTTLFHVGVPWRTPWRRDLPGAVLAMLLWFAAAAGLRAYLALGGAEQMSRAGTEVYQQLGAPIAMVLWLYVSAVAVLLGAELNAEIERTWPTRPPDARREVPGSPPAT